MNKKILFSSIFVLFLLNIMAQIPGDRVLTVTNDEFGNLWIGTDNGLLIKSGETYQAYQMGAGIPGNVIDIENQITPTGSVMWISSNLGLHTVSYSAIGITSGKVLSKEVTKIDDDLVTAIAFDDKNSGFFATTKGIGIFSGNIWKYLTEIPEITENLFTSAKAKGDTIYFGTKGEGVGRLVKDVDGYTGASSLVNPWSGLAGDSINCVFVDSKGYRWFGTTKGLSRHSKLDAKEGWDFNLTTQLPQKNVNCLAEDKTGKLWIGTNGGLVKLSPALSIEQVYSLSNGLPSNLIHSISIGKDDIVWIGTDKGLVKIQGSTLTPIKTSVYTQNFKDIKLH